MRTKNTIIFSLISAFFLISLISIWKILATLQGLNINSFNIEVLFIFGFLISVAHLGISDRIKCWVKLYIVVPPGSWFNYDIQYPKHWIITATFDFKKKRNIIIHSPVSVMIVVDVT